MEAASFLIWMDAMRDDGRLDQLATLVVDQDLTIARTMSENHAQIRVAADPGHVRKSLRNAFKQLFTTRQPFRCMAYRMASWYMRVLKAAENATDRIVDEAQRASKIMQLQRQHLGAHGVALPQRMRRRLSSP